MTGSGPFRTFLEAMAKDEDTCRGGVSASLALDALGKERWLVHLEGFARKPGAPLGRAILALLGVEEDELRKRRLLACAAEPPFAVRKREGDTVIWKLVRPLGCELASVASIRLDADERVLEASYAPLAPWAWDEGFEGAALGDATLALAHAVVHDAIPLRPVLLPFLELFSARARPSEVAA